MSGKVLVDHLLIVGGGAAAFAAATRAADLGVNVTMINAGLPLGGTCVNVGCMPSKFLLEGVRRYSEGSSGNNGWLASSAKLDYAMLKRAKDEMVAAARKMNYYDVITALGNVALVEGRAFFTGPKEVKVNGQRYAADRVLIATGARTTIPSIPGLAEAEPLTYVDALDLEKLPSSMTVVGGGPLGLEFAQIFGRAGVNVELMGRILPQNEPEISEALARYLTEEGIALKVGCRLQRVEGKPGNFSLYDSGGCVARTERVLVATGIRPNTDNMGLEKVGTRVDNRGFIEVDERLETSVPGIYAAGDVIGKMPLEPVAAKLGFLAAHNALTGESKKIDFDLVPSAVFTDPQVASVGWTEEKMMREMGTCFCRKAPLEWLPKAIAVGDTRGLVKLVVHPKTRKILGAHALAPNAAEIIHVPLLAMKAGMTLDDLIDTVHCFPTYAEIWKLCAQTFDRNPDAMSCCIV